MIIYSTFYRRFVFRRTAQLGKLTDKTSLEELPKASVLHLLDDNFSFNKPITFVPNLNNWSMQLKPKYKFIHHVKEPPQPTLHQYSEYFRLPTPGLNIAINNLRRNTLRFMKPLKDLMDMPTRQGVINIINYNPLFRARIYGMRRSVRRFNYIWTSVLNMINKLPNTHMHYIPIPIGSSQYERSHFLTSFKGYTRASIKFPEDPWYLFMMNLIGYLHQDTTESLFEKIPERLRKNIHFILYGKTKVFIFNLEDMKRMNGDSDAILIRFIKTLNLLAEDSLEAVAPAEIIDQIDQTQFKGGGRDDIEETFAEDDKDFDENDNIISTKQDPYKKDQPSKNTSVDTVDTESELVAPEIILPDLIMPISISNEPGSLRVTSQPRKIKKVITKTPPELQIPELVVDTSKGLDKKEFRKIPKQLAPKSSMTPQVKQTKAVNVNVLPKQVEKPIEEPTVDTTEVPILIDVPEIDSNLLTVEKTKPNSHNRVIDIPKQKLIEYSNKFIEDLDARAEKAIEDNKHRLTSAQELRAKKMSVQYKEIVVNGKSLLDIIKEVPDDTIATNTLDFLKDKVPDNSMIKSSIQSFDHDYIEKLMAKDLMTNLVSFNSQGMFLKDVALEDVSDDLNHMMTCKAKYEDIHHKEHTIKFTLPKIDSNGYCMVNGTAKIFRKQRVILPICKTSNTRVTLNSDYNKFLVERNTSVAHSLISYIDRILGAAEPRSFIAIINGMKFPKETLPYDYTALASKYIKIITKKNSIVTFYFNYPERYNWLHKEMNLTNIDIDAIKAIEDELNGVFFGITKENTAVFMMMTGEVKIYNYRDETLVEKDICFIDLLDSLLDVSINRLSEWIDFKLLNKSVPLAFALCYRYGLNYMLNYTKTKYTVVKKGTRVIQRNSDIVIPFADVKLIIPRAPLVNSLIFAGLNNYNLSKVEIEAMNTKDVYYELLQSKGMSIHNLKGIDDYFELFIDPITRDVLLRMGEPIDPKDLLIRAAQLLSTEDFSPPASEANYRYRSYERFNTAVYKSIARAYATYKNKALGATNRMSISEFEVKQLIIQDQLMENADIINPINDIKYNASFSHSGFGGRMSVDTFVLDDRQYPKDGLGSISEATVDNMKTGYVSSLSVDPVFANMRGMPKPINIDDIEPAQMLSISSMLVPCVTNDDGKRRSKCAAYR